MDQDKLSTLYQNKSSEELIDIINDSKYTDEAKLLAASILEYREQLTDNLKLSRENIINNIEKEKHYYQRHIRKYETFWPRVFSALIDAIALLILGIILSFIFYLLDIFDIKEFVLLIIPFIYSILMHSYYGQTIGKMFMGIRVYDKDERERINMKQAIMRDIIPLTITILLYFSEVNFTITMILSFISSSWSFLEIITMLVSPKNRALHDYIAGTTVIRH